MATPHRPTQNHLLAALAAAKFKRLSPHLELVPMPLGEALYESGTRLVHVYFPTTSIVSVLYVLADGASAEIAACCGEVAAPSTPQAEDCRPAMHYSAGVDATAQAYPVPLLVMECPRRSRQLIPEMNHRIALRAQPWAAAYRRSPGTRLRQSSRK